MNLYLKKHYNLNLKINKLKIFNHEETYVLDTVDSFIYK